MAHSHKEIIIIMAHSHMELLTLYTNHWCCRGKHACMKVRLQRAMSAYPPPPKKKLPCQREWDVVQVQLETQDYLPGSGGMGVQINPAGIT